MRTRRQTQSMVVLLLAGALLFAACGGANSSAPGGSNASPLPDEPDPVDPGPTPPGPPPPGVPTARLDRIEGCDELRETLWAVASDEIRRQAEYARALDVDTVNPRGGPAPEPMPAGDPSIGFEEDDREEGDFSDTNVQVAGVDEADWVETDGERIYFLHGSTFMVVDSWPPTALSVLGSATIEGVPVGMFVADGRAAVFSQVYEVAGAKGGRESCGPPDVAQVVAPGGEPAVVADIAFCDPGFTKVTVLDLAEEPTPAREIYFEGRYNTARRHGSVVRVLAATDFSPVARVPSVWTQFYDAPLDLSQEDFVALVDQWEQSALASIEEISLDEWLPGQWERRSGGLELIPPLCSSVYFPPDSDQAWGITRVLGLDMNQDEGEIHDSLVIGYAWQVYAGPDRLVITHPAPSESGAATNRSALHVFGIGAQTLETSYLGSGYVPGEPLNQFSFDVQEDVLRVSTTQSFWDAQDSFRTQNQILTTRIEDGALKVIGTTGGIAPDERIFATRFVGDRGYLVTFRRIDPLFVVDLSDPANPTVLGEVELPGFSDYMQPLGEDHLLTIGRDADEQGRDRGLALRIFDVSNDAQPLLAHDYFFSEEGWSAANRDHLSFVFSAKRGLLTFPYVSYEGEYRSVLELFSVDTNQGFQRLGAVDHTALTNQECGSLEQWQCGYSPEVRRGLFIEDYLYSLGPSGVLVHDTADLEAELARLDLPPVSFGPARPPPTLVR